MIWVGAVAILFNGLTALMFARGRASDINVRAAFQHMAADAAISAGVVVAGALIIWTGQQWLDPAMSLLVAAVILWGSIGLLRESIGMSLMGVPASIDLEEVEAELSQLSGVDTVHDLTSGRSALQKRRSPRISSRQRSDHGYSPDDCASDAS